MNTQVKNNELRRLAIVLLILFNIGSVAAKAVRSGFTETMQQTRMDIVKNVRY